MQWFLPPPFPSLLILSCRLQEPILSKCLEPDAFLFYTFLEKGVGRLLPDPALKSLKKIWNWLIFKNINLNISSNIIYLLRAIGMFHAFTYETLSLYCPNCDLYRDYFQMNRRKQVTSQKKFEVWLTSRFGNVIVSVFVMLLNLPFSVISDPWVRRLPWRRKWHPIPGLLPGEFHGRGAWRTTVHGVTKSQTWLSD